MAQTGATMNRVISGQRTRSLKSVNKTTYLILFCGGLPLKNR